MTSFETPRPLFEQLSRTRDGLLIRLELEEDPEATAGYAGSLAQLWERNCPGLWSEVQYDFELPIQRQIAFSSETIRVPRINPTLLKKNLQKKVAHVPRSEMARLLSNWQMLRDPLALYERELEDGFVRARVTIEQRGRPVVIREVSGIPTLENGMLKEIKMDALREARALLGWKP